ncbi:hypothetical protein GCM10009779_09350 [Polymorphospora rubra]|uniref:Uncharacterized protein n=1 Tax=Polymorphospora rubra TaxID=338584 RepID=A0A810N7N3_9ACTN|nr:hypothetical protein Prubr_66230 [Polymorphospora rubra]
MVAVLADIETEEHLIVVVAVHRIAPRDSSPPPGGLAPTAGSHVTKRPTRNRRVAVSLSAVRQGNRGDPHWIVHVMLMGDHHREAG